MIEDGREDNPADKYYTSKGEPGRKASHVWETPRSPIFSMPQNVHVVEGGKTTM